MNELNDFTSLFISYTKSYESPESFWRWSSYAIIAATLRDNVYFQHKLDKLFPNIYVVLLADSAQFRKGAPLRLASNLLLTMNHTKVIKGRNSVQYIIDRLSQDIGRTKTGVAVKGGSCILIAEELASFFVEDRALVPIVTDMYEFYPDYVYGLKGTGEVHIKNLCMNILAGSNEIFLKEVYDARATYGGLLRRTFFIKPDAPRPGASFFELTHEDKVKQDLDDLDKTELLTSLIKIKELSGPVTASKGAKSVYNDWYHDLYKSYSSQPDKSGVLQSLHTSALKLAIIIAASKYKKEIDLVDIEEAILQTTALRKNYEVYVMSTGKATNSNLGAIVLEWMWNNPDHKLRRKEILVKYWNEISLADLDDLIGKLEQAGMIRTTVSANGTDITYEMLPKCQEIYASKGVK